MSKVMSTKLNVLFSSSYIQENLELSWTENKFNAQNQKHSSINKVM